MIWRVCVFLIAAALCEVSAAAREQTNPVWLERPVGADFARNYPGAALAQSIEGRVVLECRVHLDTTAQCEVSSEQPEGWGFGAGALAISQAFRLSPATIDGRPVADSVLRVPISFLLGGPAEPISVRFPLWDDAPSPAQMAEAAAALSGSRFAALALLRCVIGNDRRLSCEPHRASPDAAAAIASALTLAGHFRVSENDIGPAKFNAGDTIFLPFLVGGPAEGRPILLMLGHYRLVDDAFQSPPPSGAVLSYFGISGLHGKVTMLCETNAILALECRPKGTAPYDLTVSGAALANRIFGQIAHDILWPGAKIELPIDFDAP